MIRVLRNSTYRNLFSAQVLALLGTGLLTVALGLLAFDLAGGAAGAVLGTALTIKMVLYVVIAPVAAAYVDRLPRRAFLIALDLFGMGASWGGYESLIVPSNPSAYRSATEWNPGGQTVRIHVGLEDPADLIDELRKGLDRLRA